MDRAKGGVKGHPSASETSFLPLVSFLWRVIKDDILWSYCAYLTVHKYLCCRYYYLFVMRKGMIVYFLKHLEENGGHTGCLVNKLSCMSAKWVPGEQSAPTAMVLTRMLRFRGVGSVSLNRCFPLVNKLKRYSTATILIESVLKTICSMSIQVKKGTLYSSPWGRSVTVNFGIGVSTRAPHTGFTENEHIVPPHCTVCQVTIPSITAATLTGGWTGRSCTHRGPSDLWLFTIP